VDESIEMKLANYVLNGSIHAALVSEGRAYDIRSIAQEEAIGELANLSTVEEIISNPGLLETLRENETKIYSKSSKQSVNSIAKLKLTSPILKPQKIFLAAVNYLAHGKEGDMKPPSEPYFFSKFQNTIVGPDDPILLPMVSSKVDWEVELAVVIGKRGKYISQSNALDYVAGYTVANDISFRDLQFPKGWPKELNALGQNWIRGKGLDTALPMGPWLVTTDEIKDPYNLELSLSVNGETRQKANTSEMLFKIETMIEYLSSGITLEPGDIISTGTPLGVAAFSGAPYLKDGDIVEAAITGIGLLRNPVRSEILAKS
jgi:2-keto-4-pentenoate hydratase/2-oxohepta-3-ene-1,7-dioic acid hydratase in catechol pathway